MKPWMKKVAGVAPVLGAALGVPTWAGTAMKAVAQAVGSGDSESEVEQAVIAASPEQLARIREAGADLEKRLAELGVDLERIAAEDRRDARALAKVNMIPQVALSAIFVVGFFLVAYWTVGQLVPEFGEFQKATITYLLGVLSGEVSGIMRFWFGSSAGSKEKTQKLSGGTGQ